MDEHSPLRENGKRYHVETISLNELLDSHKAPLTIDYLSIDTEGSEFDILKKLNFSKYRFKVITCEHNYSPNREKIYDLLKGNGYERKFKDFSKFDDWYILK